MNIIKLALEDKDLRYLFFIVALNIPLSIFVTTETYDLLSLMLGWNVILAFIPVILAFIFYEKSLEDNETSKDKIILVLLFLSWLFFFPNAYYIITDFIHLGGDEFYYREHIYAPLVYLNNYVGYLTLVHIFLSAYIGVFMATYSLKLIDSYLVSKFSKGITFLFITLILLLSSLGIYIGRFLRFNSWDTFRPFNIINELIDSFTVFSLEFILMFFITQLILYYLLKPFIKKTI